VSTTNQHQTPVSDVPIVVNDAAGGVVLVTHTGADGTAAVEVPRGGSVASFTSSGLTFSVQAVVDPPNNATVLFRITEPDPPQALTQKTTFQILPSQVPQGTSDVAVYTCDDRGPVWGDDAAGFAATADNGSCLQGATSSFLAVALDKQGQILAWGTALDQPNAPGGTVKVSVPLSVTAVAQVAAEIQDIPQFATHVYLDSHAIAANASSPFDFRAGGQPYPISSTFQKSLTFPAGIFKSYSIAEEIVFDMAPSGGYVHSSSSLSRERTYVTLPSSSNFSAASMAFVSVDPLDASDPEHPQATWSTGAGPRGDYGQVAISWWGGTAGHGYTVTFPPDHVAAFRVPDIPPELSSFAPTKTSTFSAVDVTYVDNERVTGYADSTVFHDLLPMDGLGTLMSTAYNAP
jgi:hypothetical protein